MFFNEDGTLNELMLLESEQPQKKVNWKLERVKYFMEHFESVLRKRCPVGFPMAMRLLTVYAEDRWSYPNEDTGEITFDIPPIDDWKEQVDGFFKDEFAAKNTGFHFSYFLKQYGRFVKYEPKKSVDELYYLCPDCRQNVKRSNRESHRYVCPKYVPKVG